MSTLKQKAVASKLLENGGNVSKSMVEAGYSPATAHTPGKLTSSKGFKTEIAPVVDKLKGLRDASINELEAKKSKLGAADYSDLITGVEKLSRTIQLLEGKPTDRLAWINEYDQMTDEELRKIALSEPDYTSL